MTFNVKGSEFYQHGKALEEKLDNFLQIWLPDYAFEMFENGPPPGKIYQSFKYFAYLTLFPF